MTTYCLIQQVHIESCRSPGLSFVKILKHTKVKNERINTPKRSFEKKLYQQEIINKFFIINNVKTKTKQT
jgi:hypothetical protein